jgi:hypothetical protein
MARSALSLCKEKLQYLATQACKLGGRCGDGGRWCCAQRAALVKRGRLVSERVDHMFRIAIEEAHTRACHAPLTPPHRPELAAYHDHDWGPGRLLCFSDASLGR